MPTRDVSALVSTGGSRWATGGHVADHPYHVAHESSNGGLVVTETVLANMLYAVRPFYCPRTDATLTTFEIGWELNFGADGAATTRRVRMGLYQCVSNRDLYPGELIIDAGEFLLQHPPHTAFKWTGATRLTAGVYWIIMQTNAQIDWKVLTDAFFDQNDFPLLGYQPDCSHAQHLVLVPRLYAELPLKFPDSGLSQVSKMSPWIQWST